MNFSYTAFFLLFTAFAVSASRVLELSDKFLDFVEEGQWFVKFYAPWCAHCRRMEPVWAQVAQALYNTPIKVAKVDCTRFQAVASHFNVHAYPTILFIKGKNHYEYHGEREREDMVSYAMRMSQPAVQSVTQADSMGYLKEAHSVFFAYVGRQEGNLWEFFTLHAEKYQQHSWFYAVTHEILRTEVKPPNDTAVFVYKDDSIFFFDAHPSVIEDKDALNVTLDKWINSERFGFFPKITRSNINHLMDTEKYIVMAVVSENKLKEISQIERDFRDMVEGIIRKKKSTLHARFQFGWTGSLELANSIAMTELSVPHLLVLNATTSHHHLPLDEPALMTPDAVAAFLDQVHNQVAPTYGGSGWWVRLYRALWEARAALAGMWRGNPVLTVLVFGLPLGFLSLICYSICCADILDADEEEDDETHEKKD